MPVEREYAEGVSVVHPPERQNALEVVVPPERREKAEVWIVAVSVAPPEEREHAVVVVPRVELADRPEEIELVILAVAVPFVLRPDGAEREMVVAPRDDRPDDRPDRLAPVGERPQVHAVLDRVRELHFVAAVQRSRGELLHLATTRRQERDYGKQSAECCQCGSVASFQFLHGATTPFACRRKHYPSWRRFGGPCKHPVDNPCQFLVVVKTFIALAIQRTAAQFLELRDVLSRGAIENVVRGLLGLR